MKQFFKAEPALIISTFTTFAVAIITLLVTFGLDISKEQEEAVVRAIAATVPMILLTGGLIRQFVYSPRTMEREANKQYQAGTPPTIAQPEIPPPGEVN